MSGRFARSVGISQGLAVVYATPLLAALQTERTPLSNVRLSVGDMLTALVVAGILFLAKSAMDQRTALAELRRDRENDATRAREDREAIGLIGTKLSEHDAASQLRLEQTRHTLRGEMMNHWAQVQMQFDKGLDDLRGEVRALRA